MRWSLRVAGVVALLVVGIAVGRNNKNERAATTNAKVHTPAQVKAEAKARKAAKLRAAEARARALRQARVRAKAAAAAVKRRNAWHRGYYQQDSNVFWRWIEGRSCSSYATNGCWHVGVITRSGCSSYVGVEANEYQGDTIVGSVLGNNTGIPPKTEVIIELDADQTGVTPGDVQIDCL